ncbi:polysaccharide pyruvyl transferase family protein [Winogradskyella thalassocola]|uniref:Polysaccharide pyruvyl transferase n=1 Tax=Winogradskyella thalassocola TaxID=262004 RepID=A0A1G8FXB7_9FLAO|nr:polysaccharide pyruvyl transferase family protein [Winogradskyella thalassocola]SDH86626.1 Polysaccharide pyruvyl transferase [Winogradskyella thalassocola]
MKTMVIGLGPEYNYDISNHALWSSENTRYASNHGASLISRTLIDFFNADYIDDFSKIEDYRNTYDLCVVAFATHVTNWRDVSLYTDFVKDLKIKTVAFSLGIQDYSAGSSMVNDIHHSLKDLLNYVVESSGYLGVRGPHTASVLLKSGFDPENIVNFGCPTLFAPLNRDLKIEKKKTFKNPLVVYHRTMADLNESLLNDVKILGQDFLDEVVFVEAVDNEQVVKKAELGNYKLHKNGENALTHIKSRGMFVHTFDEWYAEVAKHDFVLGARLHGCVAALIQGIPAVMIARDVRVEEIAEFYKIPYIKYEDIGNLSIQDIFDQADYSEFNNLYKHRFDNFMKLMADLNLSDNLSFEIKEPSAYWYNKEDLNANTKILFRDLAQLSERLNHLEKKQHRELIKISKKIDKITNTFRKIPGYNFFKKTL